MCRRLVCVAVVETANEGVEVMFVGCVYQSVNDGRWIALCSHAFDHLSSQSAIVN